MYRKAVLSDSDKIYHLDKYDEINPRSNEKNIDIFLFISLILQILLGYLLFREHIYKILNYYIKRRS